MEYIQSQTVPYHLSEKEEEDKLHMCSFKHRKHHPLPLGRDKTKAILLCYRFLSVSNTGVPFSTDLKMTNEMGSSTRHFCLLVAVSQPMAADIREILVSVYS
ncbi:hypothetical protein PanWU01x14_073900 [Parasponia andersonii]|uniref:Uncharacterized protein n=1 Tax=Parasponia andersonii TaxID=3476 RepID=A0A2P5DDC2_PARAD|nr:hypothetical protein PanWU01x14_073900 [Parasponia andersonii]